MQIDVARRWDNLRTSYWFVPSVMAFAAAVLSEVTLRLDGSYQERIMPEAWWIFGGGADGARATLGAIAGSMITVASLVFSITIVSLTLASSQFGPRLLRNFMRDRGNQFTLGTFVSTFIYSLLVLRAVRSVEERAFVPHVSVTVALMLAILSVGVLIFFIHHISTSIQADAVVREAARQMDSALDRVFPAPLPTGPVPVRDFQTESPWQEDRPNDIPIRARRGDYVQTIDTDRLLEIAAARGLLIRLFCRPGDFVMEGAVVARVRTEQERLDDEVTDAICESIALGAQRTLTQDAEFGFLQLVEVAVRALSPGINDPFTAITCVDRLCSGLGVLAKRSFPSSLLPDRDGGVRVIADRTSFRGFADTAFHQIRQNAARSPAVLIRMLEGIAAILPMASTMEEVTVLEDHARLVLEEAEGGLQPHDIGDLREAYDATRVAAREVRVALSSE